MRAWQVNGQGEPSEVLELVETDPPVPGPGHIRVRVTAAGLGLPDVFMCRGTYPLTPPLPFTPGQEVCGVVTAVGEGVDLAVGTRVMAVSAFPTGHGSFAEECLAAAASTFPVPVTLRDTQAAGFWIPHLTGWIGLVDRAGIATGDRLAVLGAAGGSGIAAVQLGKALGAHVIGVVGDEERAGFCRRAGADATIVHHLGSVSDGLRTLTDGRGVDVIYDPVGGTLAEDAWRALTRHGRLLTVGFASGRWPTIPTHRLVTTNTAIVGVFAGGYARRELDDIHGRLSALLAEGRLTSTVTDEIPFAELPRALQAMADRRVVGKLVVTL